MKEEAKMKPCATYTMQRPWVGNKGGMSGQQVSDKGKNGRKEVGEEVRDIGAREII